MVEYVGFGTTAADLPLSKLTFQRRDLGKEDVKWGLQMTRRPW